jgi:GntR family transcriptional regulator of arabinose operon
MEQPPRDEASVFAWAKVAEALRRQIEEGARRPGTMIPSESELCRVYKVSRITVRAAVKHLAQQGFVTKQHGRGTFVRQRKVRQHLHIGFLVIGIDLTNPICAAVLRGAENAAIEHEWVIHYQRNPYVPRPGHRMRQDSSEANMIRRIVDEDEVKGFMVFGWLDESILEVMRTLKLPLVVLGSHQLPDDVEAWWDQVDTDDVEVGRIVGKYLSDLGHERVATPAVQPPLKTTEHVMQGLKEHLSVSIIPCIWNDLGPADIEKAVLRAFRSKPRAEWPTAILCTDDSALAVMRAARTLGLSIPQHISIVGLGDLRLNENYDPALTSVRLFPEELGRRGFRNLSARMEGTELEADESVNLVRPELIIRGSTGKPPR